MKNIFFILLSLVFTSITYAHEGGHGTPTKNWSFVNNNETIKADFIMKVGDMVYLSNENNEVLTFNYSEFKEQDQNYISEKANFINNLNFTKESHRLKTFDYSILLLLTGILVFVFSLFSWKTKPKKYFVTYNLFSASLIMMGCANTKSSKVLKMAANDIPFLESVFGVFNKVNTRHDDQYFYVESDGIPEHEMMTGITNWQQQVPVDHDYSGNNAWAIPLQPELAENTLSTKENFMKGAIAIAVNGIPIFNPLNNRGEDANVIGELDKWGGHCGRADDYHYHLPPTHLQTKVGEDRPIAFALDGFAVYGETTEELDENLGRFTSDSTYQYHAVKKYPYLIAAMKGKVELNPRTQAPENEIMPQAKTRGVRPDLRPLRGAEIIDFENPEPHQYSLSYTVNSQIHKINYGWDTDGNYNFEFVNPDGTTEKSHYKRN
ncbi:YHYH protein [Arenibacter echinorum]|uniref:YHYH protein n=1 Tax=Arenibacter echinorum TaxID=440515 RepID=A0A327RES8_9FLAO|nr:YHYH protein [Arenibacter echinorum]RAJ15409.1 YHYH protein [Arenibacter echinorum]